MHGPAPKHESVRRNRVKPQRGEWIDLPPLPADVEVPPLPEGEWSARTALAWEHWWRDAASQMWEGSDVDLVEHLAYIHEQWVVKGSGTLLGELRQVRDSLGLSPKGKQDRRWRVTRPGEVVELEGTATDRMKELRDRAATATGNS